MPHEQDFAAGFSTARLVAGHEAADALAAEAISESQPDEATVMTWSWLVGIARVVQERISEATLAAIPAAPPLQPSAGR